MKQYRSLAEAPARLRLKASAGSPYIILLRPRGRSISAEASRVDGSTRTFYHQYMARGTYIAVVDFGSQFTHLITRVLRELGIEARIIGPKSGRASVRGAAGIILSGGPRSVLKNPVPFNRALIATKLPTLGICYGLQLLMHERGGRVSPGKIREYGPATLALTRSHPLLTGWPKQSRVWMNHGDSVTKLAPGFYPIASTSTLRYAAAAHRTKPIYAVQFHPEVHHTAFGRTLYQNFAYNICGLKPQTMHGRLEKIIADVKQQVGNKKVFLFVSGGVDSTVTFALLNRALGQSHVYGLHVDTGLMRANESHNAKRALAKAGLSNLHVVRAAKIFLRNLRQAFEPEHKRQVIGQTFLEVKAGVERKLKLNSKHWLLGQGTIYPDTIESGGTKHADKIKTHHNRIGVLARLARHGKLVEPLKELYKDEVREIGAELELPRALLWAHPFPGPGLGVRVLCLDPKSATILNATQTKAVVRAYHSRVLPLMSVGVQGDERSFRQPLAIEAPYSVATKLHRRAATLVNQQSAINRVILKLAGPRLIEGTSHTTYITTRRLELARAADRIVASELRRGRVYGALWQCPVVLIPFGKRGGESIVLRPFESREAMTGQAALLPPAMVRRIVRRLLSLGGIDYLFYDLTDKPPGTVEWE